MRSIRITAVLALGCASLLAPGCASPSQRQCSLNSDCRGGHCVNGYCRTECRADTDCMNGQLCQIALGICFVPDAAGPRDLSRIENSDDASSGDDAGISDLSTDTSPDLSLRPDLFVLPRDLTAALDFSGPDFYVPPDLRGSTDQATPPDLAVAHDLRGTPDLAMVPDLAVAPDLAVPLDLARPPDLAKPPDLATPPDLTMLLPYGNVCTDSAQCKPMAMGAFAGMGVCSSNPWAVGDHECLGDCNVNQANAACMPGDVCLQVNNAAAACAQSDIGAKANCASGADCRSGACFPGFYCTRVCSSAADCPGGWTCSSAGGGTRACINVDAMPVCNSGLDCQPTGAYCDPSHRCLGDCRSNADCPLRHTCQTVSGVKMCVPQFSNGGGGVGTGCNGPGDCRSGYCGGNKCIAPCGVTRQVGQWCPGGYGCNPVASGMSNVLACVTAGNGSIGAACIDNSSCASGLCVTDNNNQTYCSRFCNDAPCTVVAPNCTALNLVADGVSLKACEK